MALCVCGHKVRVTEPQSASRGPTPLPGSAPVLKGLQPARDWLWGEGTQGLQQPAYLPCYNITRFQFAGLLGL